MLGKYNKGNYECLKNRLVYYQDALKDIFGNFELKITDEKIYIISELGCVYKIMIDSNEKDSLFLSTKDDFKYDGFSFWIEENEIYVTEIKIDIHKLGANSEIIVRKYGKSRYDENRDVLLDIQATSYVVKKYSNFSQLMDEEYLKNNSSLTTVFSAHMRYFHKIEGEIRSVASTIYPSHVYFNGEDISQVYEFVDGIDKISRIYNLYAGNVKKESDDIKTIITGLADEKSFNYKNTAIGNQVLLLIGELRDIDVQEQMIEELIEKRSGKPNPVIIGLRDATRVEIGITPTQSRSRLDDNIDEIVYDKPSEKIKRLIEKLIPSKK